MAHSVSEIYVWRERYPAPLGKRNGLFVTVWSDF